MPETKTTMLFAQGTSGWSESYHLDGSSSDLQSEMDKLNALAAKRIAFSGKETRIDFLRCSREQYRGDAYLKNYTGNAYYGNQDKDSDSPSVAILVRMQNATRTKTSNKYIRGIWDADVVQGGKLVVNDAEFTASFNAFRSALTGGGFGFMAADVANQTKNNIANVAPNANGQLVYTTAGAAFPAPLVGQHAKIFVSGLIQPQTGNGSKIVLVLSTTSCSTLKPVPAFDYAGGGILTYSPKKFELIKFADMQKVCTRHAGRPFSCEVGKTKSTRGY